MGRIHGAVALTAALIATLVILTLLIAPWRPLLGLTKHDAPFVHVPYTGEPDHDTFLVGVGKADITG